MSERKIREWAWPHIKNFRTYIDIGACQGDTSIPFIGEFDKVIAFEPNPAVFDKIPNNIIKYNFALGDKEELQTIILPNGTEHPEHGSIVRYNGDEFLNSPRIQIEVKTLDSFDFTDVDFIKIDVEHYEMNVCIGAQNTIKKYMPTILFENKRNEADHVKDWLESIGYKTIKHKSETVAYKD